MRLTQPLLHDVGARATIYDDAAKQALIVLWEASDRVCGKRLKPLLTLELGSLGLTRALDAVVRRCPTMLGSITINQATNHLLIRHFRARRVRLKEGDTSLAQGKRYLNSIFLQDELVGRRKEILDDFEPAQGFICVFCGALHKPYFFLSNSRRR